MSFNVLAKFFSLVGVCLLGACGAGTKGPSEAGATVIAQREELTLVSTDGQTETIYTGNSEIEALAGDGYWLVWSEDNRNNVMLGNYEAPDQFAAIELDAVGHDLDLICIAPLTGDHYDLFVHDGDHFFYHYWLSPAQQRLTLVRLVATNPDVEACAVSADELVFADRYLGPLAIKRDPETDAIVRPAQSAAALGEFDLLSLVAGRSGPEPAMATPTVNAVLETQPVRDGGDAADDPVVLAAGRQTWMVGTNKRRGLAAYDLAGQEQAFVARGRINNVDAVALGEGRYLLAASNRTEKTIDLFTAHPVAGELEFLAAVPLTMDDPYGLCMADIDGQVQVFVGDSDSIFEHWQLSADYKTGERVAAYEFDSQTEGCVYDSVERLVYVGQEDTGIFAINPQTQARQLRKAVDNQALFADVEGMDIYAARGQRFLVVSSQGDDSYVIFNLENWTQAAKFRIVADVAANIDGASETDGLAVTSTSVPGFPHGFLVVQDGRNRAPLESQNFKVVDWRDLQEIMH